MNDHKKLFLFIAFIPVLAACEAACGMAGIKTHWYVWEILLDAKTILLASGFVLLLKPAHWRNEAREKGVLNWSIWKNLGAFLIAAILSGMITGAGLLLKKVGYADPENGATMLLTMLFDIPAIFIFSVTTVFVEEFLFRGFIFSEFERKEMAGTGLIVSSLLWTIYAMADLLPLEEFSWITIGILVLFYLSVGITSGVLYAVSRSVWVSYAFRIGIITITPVVLSGAMGDTDAFFSTENIFFLGDGIIASVILIAVFMTIFFVSYNKKNNAACVCNGIT